MKKIGTEMAERLKRMPADKRVLELRKILGQGGIPAYKDEVFYKTEVSVVEIRLADGRVFLMGREGLEDFKKFLNCDVKSVGDDQSEYAKWFVLLGDVQVHRYDLRECGLKTMRFCELPFGTQTFILRKQKDLFADVEKDFSPSLQVRLKQLRNGELGDSREYVGGKG